MSSRRPAVAGVFYPSDRHELQLSIEAAFAEAAPSLHDSTSPKALIVPHAGYIYSGAVAASAFRRIAPARKQIHRVVLLGPSHRVYVRGIAVPSVDSFDTPLGPITIDAELRAAILCLPAVVIDDEPHRREHSL
ncbi:MAG: AmmeMemoRadiSam system protein B, partial [Acidimicrobiales bacterium]|nr:AmmeMemoRadiSam system protein B [Acidimicrobiales bacterium]